MPFFPLFIAFFQCLIIAIGCSSPPLATKNGKRTSRFPFFYAQYIGQEAEVLFEKASKGKAMHGFTKNYIRVELSPKEAREEYDNEIIRVKLVGFNHDKSALKCEIIQ